MRLFTVTLCALIVAGGAWAGDDSLIAPGKSVGKVTRSSTMKDLQQAYDKKNVMAQKLHLPEGESAEGAVLFGSDAKRRLQVAWTDAEGTTCVQWIRISGKTSDWHTSEGITLGTSLSQLEILNGRPFKLFGFAWDYGGTVSNWQGGKLESVLKDTRLVLEPPKTSGESYKKVMGDREFSSDNPHMRTLNPRVRQITVNFE